MASTSSDFVLLLEVDDGLFKTCFGKDDEWPCRLESVGRNCSREEIERKLARKPASVVFEDTDVEHLDLLKRYYEAGGLLVYFGIYGEFRAPSWLSEQFGLQWRFSGYTKYDYVLTDVGKQVLGDSVTDQQYSKSNLLNVPEQDILMMPKVPNFEEYMFNHIGLESYEDEDEATMAQYRTRHERLIQDLHGQVPMALHRSRGDGRIAYLGFVNGDGNIPRYVRALCSGTKV